MHLARVSPVTLFSLGFAALAPLVACSNASPEGGAVEQAVSANTDFVQGFTKSSPPRRASEFAVAAATGSTTAPCAAARPHAGAALTRHRAGLSDGPVIQRPHVFNVGFGPVDSGPALNSFVQWLVGGSYVTSLGEYGVGGGSFGGGFQGAGRSPSTVTDSNIQSFIDGLVSQGRLPENEDGNQVYVIYTSPGVTVVNDHNGGEQSCRDFCGYHSSFSANAFSPTRYYAVIPDAGGACASTCWAGDNLKDREKAVSHELSEAFTDPGGSTWYDSATGDENGDLCNSAFYTTAHGYTVQCEWSNRANGCVDYTPAE